MRYFAAQTYIDLYAKTQDIRYLQNAYEIALDNVNWLCGEQKAQNVAYLADVMEQTVPKDATEMEAVILGNNAASVMGDASRKRMVRHLEYATSIALDQFNGFKKTLLLDLQLFEVPELPARITDTIDNGGIDFSASGQTHRKYTHLGWTYVYE